MERRENKGWKEIRKEKERKEEGEGCGEVAGNRPPLVAWGGGSAAGGERDDGLGLGRRS